ncbi:cytochrome P450-SU2 [Paraburkholderia xenovorans LB400]|uniref:Cytochrome P450 n=1 Tax=Paraburkholderia xenovorans (strain LB400) TaxID=266265 RepID=Q13GG9_PARXL|nr:cytochrome P450 [Paraburkholderia xenovorans]ABE36820.1 Putative cytochrome P450 [Paraburkholderia xenovorans LB400]AIP34198.1 cytochrome P450-SU2 [Paraburkholderia xenovorans LB400]
MTSAINDVRPQTTSTFPFARTGSPLHPPAEYARYRDGQPVTRVQMWDGRYAWIFTRMEDVKAVLSSPHFSVVPSKPGYPFLTPARAATVKSYQTFITMDPPDHTRFRRMLTRDFTQKRMEELRPQIAAYVNRLIDEMLARGSPGDLVSALALKLPVTVVSMLVGVPYEDHEDLVKWSGQRLDLEQNPTVSESAADNMLAYFDGLLQRKERDPGDGADMLSRLVIEQIKPGHLSRLEAIHMVNLLYFAGHETTANQIALGTLSFLLDPRQRALLENNPGLLKNAIEEMLRFHTISHYNSCRVATADVEVGGTLIREGEGAYALIMAANRDPAAFPAPDRFDIERPNSQEHVAFSYGLHMCLGQPLARLELQVCFEALFRRLPRLRLAVPLEELPFKREMYVYGLHALPVTW